MNTDTITPTDRAALGRRLRTAREDAGLSLRTEALAELGLISDGGK